MKNQTSLSARASPSPAARRIQAAALKLFAETGATRTSVSELAAQAGVARGTVYANVERIDNLFEEIAAQLVREMLSRLTLAFADLDDPARRLAIGVRQYVRRAHEEPVWGRFMSRFGMNESLLRAVWSGAPMNDLEQGIASGRYKVSVEQLPAAIVLISGSTLAAMLPVLDGQGTWRDVGSNTAELVLVGLGLTRKEARALARSELPPLPPAPEE